VGPKQKAICTEDLLRTAAGRAFNFKRVVVSLVVAPARRGVLFAGDAAAGALRCVLCEAWDSVSLGVTIPMQNSGKVKGIDLVCKPVPAHGISSCSCSQHTQTCLCFTCCIDVRKCLECLTLYLIHCFLPSHPYVPVCR